MPSLSNIIAYLAALEKDIRHQPLALEQDGAPLHLLEEVYVGLRAAERHGIAGARTSPEGGPQPLNRFLAVAAARCFSVLGEPGSGKSTLLKQLALTKAQWARRDLEAGRDPGPATVPVLVRLADLDALGEGPFEHIERTRGRFGLPEGTHVALAAQAAAGRVLFLLDGLDEVPADRLQALLVQVRRVAGERDWLHAGCRVVVTSRPFGYQPPAGHFLALDLLPLSAEGRRRLLENWLSPQAADRGQIAKIATAIQSQPSLRTLAGNPFLLTLMVLLALEQVRAGGPIALPARRAQVLAAAIDYLLRGGPRATSASPALREQPKVRRLLEDLALGLLRIGAGPYDLDSLLDLVRAGEAFPRLAQVLPAWSDPEKVLSEVAQATGLLIAVDVFRMRWRFQHRALQERLAAAALHRAGAPAWSTLAKQLGQDSDRLGQWAETFALLAGERGEEETLLRELATVNPDLAIRALASAGDRAVAPATLLHLLGLEKGSNAWGKRRDVIRELCRRLGASCEAVGLVRQIRRTTSHGADLFFVRKALEAIADDASEAAVTVAAREELGGLFDHLTQPPDLSAEMVELPDGRRLPYWCEVTGLGAPFFMGRVPVTNALYERFDREHRHDRVFADKVSHNELDQHPVVNVTWFEAETFCRWLAQRNPGVALPPEQAWEHAATNGDGRTYPWGSEEPTKELSNFGLDVGRTTPVGAYPKGAGPFGTLDQAGNVDEWCLDAWNAEASPEPQRDSVRADTRDSVDIDTVDRAVRGGSWYSDPRNLAAAFRDRNWARFQLGDVGFRCAMGWPPSTDVDT